jgi:DNA-binding NarL/FixJ family response regulator
LYEGARVQILKILVVDDHALVREGLAQVLQGLNPMEATEVLQASNCADAFAFARGHRDLDLVLLDYHLPDMNGVVALGVFGERHPELPVVILSGSANPSIMQQAFTQGAAGFITKSGGSNELLAALRRVLEGELYRPSNFAPLDQNVLSSRSAPQNPPILSQRQQEVLQLLLNGCSNRQISEQLELGDETVKYHVANIFQRFNVNSRMQAAHEAKRWGYAKD